MLTLYAVYCDGQPLFVSERNNTRYKSPFGSTVSGVAPFFLEMSDAMAVRKELEEANVGRRYSVKEVKVPVNK